MHCPRYQKVGKMSSVDHIRHFSSKKDEVFCVVIQDTNRK